MTDIWQTAWGQQRQTPALSSGKRADEKFKVGDHVKVTEVATKFRIKPGTGVVVGFALDPSHVRVDRDSGKVDTYHMDFWEVTKNPAAVALGRAGGLKGGRTRADVLSPERKRQIASEAAKKRWGKS